MPARSVVVPAKISLSNATTFRHMLIYWFADAAIRFSQNRTLESVSRKVSPSDVNAWINTADLLEDKDYRTSIRLTTKDKRELFGKQFVLEQLRAFKDFLSGCSSKNPDNDFVDLPMTFSQEFLEFTKVLAGKGKPKRDIYKVSKLMLALAQIGAAKTFAAKITGAPGQLEYVYVMMSGLYAQDLSSAIVLPRILVAKNAPMITVIVGAAAGLFHISARQNRVFLEVVRIGATGNRPLLKSKDTQELLGLRNTLYRLGIGFPIYLLAVVYPDDKMSKLRTIGKSASKVRRSIDEIMLRVMQYYWYRTPYYLYMFGRIVRDEGFEEALKEVVAYEVNKDEKLAQFLQDLLGVSSKKEIPNKFYDKLTDELRGLRI